MGDETDLVGHADCEAAEMGAADDVKKKGRHRPRKKKLYNDICKQVEFYFSDANVSKNRTMLELINAAEYVDLEQLLKFNKLLKMVPDLSVSYLQKALANSEILELAPDLKGIKRKTPYDPSKLKSTEEIETCTIYVENVPCNVDQEWLEKIFQEFGPVAYVAVPKFKHNGMPKGFAFVEFKDSDGAERCLKAYGDIGACLPSNLNPENLLSVRTYEQNEGASPRGRILGTDQEITEKTDTSPNLRKRHAVNELTEQDVALKKKKLTGNSDEQGIRTENIPVDEEFEEENDGGINNSNHEKKKRRKMCKTKKADDIEKRESDSIQLKILPKKIWRQLRNRYLNVQRENLGKLKRQLRYQGQANLDQGLKYKEQSKGDNPQPAENKPKNVLVRLELMEPFESDEALKSMLLTALIPSEHANVLRYVDYTPDETSAVVRLDGSPRFFDVVGDFLRSCGTTFKSFAVFNDQQTKEYWSSIRAKIKPDPKKKVRGRDKLLQQAMKTATHIRFTDDCTDEDKATDSKEEIAEPDSSSLAN